MIHLVSTSPIPPFSSLSCPGRSCSPWEPHRPLQQDGKRMTYTSTTAHKRSWSLSSHDGERSGAFLFVCFVLCCVPVPRTVLGMHWALSVKCDQLTGLVHGRLIHPRTFPGLKPLNPTGESILREY